MIEWTVERFQDALLIEELDPGLFSRSGNRAEKTAARIDQFLELLAGAIGAKATVRAASHRPPAQGVTPDPADFVLETDLASAATLPSTWYRDPRRPRARADRVFARTWQLVGHTEQVRLPGRLLHVHGRRRAARRDAGRGRRDPRVLERLPAPRRPGRARRRPSQGAHVRLPRLDLHARRHASSRRRSGTASAASTAPPRPCRRCASRPGGRFSSSCLDPDAPPLARVLGAIPEETRHLPLEHMRLFKKVDYEVACNWKVYVDNYLEGYHIPIVHPELFKELDYRAYRVETAILALEAARADPLEERGLALPPQPRRRRASRRRSTTGSSPT